MITCLTWLAVTPLILSASKRALVTFDWKQLETRCLARFKDFFLLFWFSAVSCRLEVINRINNLSNFWNYIKNDFSLCQKTSGFEEFQFFYVTNLTLSTKTWTKDKKSKFRIKMVSITHLNCWAWSNNYSFQYVEFSRQNTKLDKHLFVR